MAVGSDLNAAIVQRKEKWSQGESNRYRRKSIKAEIRQKHQVDRKLLIGPGKRVGVPERAQNVPDRGRKCVPVCVPIRSFRTGL